MKKKNVVKGMSLMMAAALMAGGVSAGVRAEESDPFLTGEKPELNVLYVAQPYDMNEDPGKAIMESVTGYEVNYNNLPAENADEKLMLEVASGADYDMLYRMNTSVFSQLVDKNALMDLRPLLEQYGKDILENVDDLTWSAVTDEEGHIWGIPLDAADPSTRDYPGSIQGGIAFRSDTLEALGYELPTTLDEFYELCKAYTEATGNPALTLSRTGWVEAIMSAFGLGGASWYEVDGVLTPRIKMEGFQDYVAFLQKLYSEGLMDNDMPINAGENAKEKFTGKTALCMPLNFYDIPAIKDALALSNPDAKVVFTPLLAKDEDTPAFLSSNQGVTEVSVITKNAKNPEHAIIWYNAISNTENFKQIYIGEENVSYEVKDGSYYPIFPAFSEYTNSDKYTGTVTYEERQKEWEARARKTTEMAEAFDQLNEHLDEFDFYLSCEGFVTDPSLNEYQPALNTAIGDLLVKAIAEGTDTQEVLDEMLETWEREGGLECEAAMQQWYDDHAELLGK